MQIHDTYDDSLLKTDKIGRLRYTPEQKKAMVDAYLASGLSAPRFATLHGVNYQTLISWIKKRNAAEYATPRLHLIRLCCRWCLPKSKAPQP